MLIFTHKYAQNSTDMQGAFERVTQCATGNGREPSRVGAFYFNFPRLWTHFGQLCLLLERSPNNNEWNGLLGRIVKSILL